MVYFLKRYSLIVIIVGLIFIGFILLQRQPNMEAETAPMLETDAEQEASEASATEDVEEPQLLIVDLKGEITRPGVYHLAPDARVVNAIEMAGGFTDKANEKQVNLAQRIHDEMFLYIPAEGEEAVLPDGITPGETADSGKAGDKIRINQATLDDLTTLNGIGPSKAQAILDYIEEHGSLQEPADLLNITGIGEKTLESLEDDIIIP